MTNEEAIKILDKQRIEYLEEWVDYGRVNGAYQMAIEALEQQTEDAISRQGALDAFGLSEKTRKYGGDHSGYDTMMLYEIQNVLEGLPPVTPKQRTGHWIRWYEQKENDWVVENILHCKCSECGKEYDPHSSQFIKYCNECGARMIEPQESEDKE